MQWKRDNPKADIVKQMLCESLVRVHLFEQRLVDKRVFWDGSETDYRVMTGRKTADLGDEDRRRKEQEFERWYPMVMKWKNDLLKIALAEKIEITGESLDIASLISQYQKGKNGEGERDNHRCNGCKVS